MYPPRIASYGFALDGGAQLGNWLPALRDPSDTRPLPDCPATSLSGPRSCPGADPGGVSSIVPPWRDATLAPSIA